MQVLRGVTGHVTQVRKQLKAAECKKAMDDLTKQLKKLSAKKGKK